MARKVQWVYAIGSSWARYDTAAEKQIENLWHRDAAGWIKSQVFGDYVYIDTSHLSMTYGTYTYTIARRYS
ncbi:hypothetical protein BC940DRAFT_289065 [Gongronella butleri]|nr:hypothetical protein BC940DRAFT_289065 [Gongronella butleri]